MIRYLLDTNICIYIIKRKPEQVLRKLRRRALSEVGISAITLSELEHGVSKSSRREQNQMALAAFIAPIEILRYDASAAQQYGRLRADLERAGQTIGSLDMLIAAHALSLECVLVTNDEDEFRRVSGLAIQNWAK